jgi:predicted phosphate transport protein (TIGR00153 family)
LPALWICFGQVDTVQREETAWLSLRLKPWHEAGWEDSRSTAPETRSPDEIPNGSSRTEKPCFWSLLRPIMLGEGDESSMVFRNRQKEIQASIADYCKQVTACMDTLQHAIEAYSCEPDRDLLRKNVAEMHVAESRADDIRTEIEVLMYNKVVFPGSRKDILELLETMDKVPNSSESALRMLLTHRIEIPALLTAKILQIVGLTNLAARSLLDAAQRLFHDYTNASVVIGKVDQLESEVDHVEAEITEEIFASDLDGCEKVILRDFVQHLGKISDRAEDAGQRIKIIVAKRRI